MVAALFGVLFSIAISPPVDPDLPWHLATGRWILRTSAIPKTDPFSWSAAGRTWIAHEWLSEILLFSAWRVGSWPLLILGAATVITLAWGVLHQTIRRSGLTPIASSVITALAAVSTVHTWGVRPQMLTLLFVTITGLRLHQWRNSELGRIPWELAPLIAIWANLHGGFIFGIAMVGVFAAGALGEQLLHRFAWTRGGRPVGTWKRLVSIWALLGACVAASLATPNTINGLIYPFTYLGDNASTRYVGEWFAPNFLRVQFWPFALFGIGVIGLMVIERRHVGLTDLGLTLPFLLLGLQSARNISQATVCGAPVLATLWGKRRDRRHRVASSTRSIRLPQPGEATLQQKGLIAAAVGAGVVGSLLFMTAGDISQSGVASRQAAVQPVIATEWLVKHPGGKLLNHYNYGGWLIWNRIPVAMDGRPDMYGDEAVEKYVKLTSAAGDWKSELDRLGVDRVLLPASNQLAKALAADPEWWSPVNDPVAVLFLRTQGPQSFSFDE